MYILPSGKKKQIIAQVLQNQLDGFSNYFPQDKQIDKKYPYVDSEKIQGQGKKNDFINQFNDLQKKEYDKDRLSKKDGNDDLMEFIFDKIEEFGYPRRRLYDFEEKFITEKLMPNSLREITIIVPDRYYGENKRLSEKDVKDLIENIKTKFNLNFVEGERKDKKLTMKFNSSNEENRVREEGEEEVERIDELDEIFGEGTSSNSKKKDKKINKKAPIMSQKDMFHNELKKAYKNKG